MVVLLGTSNKDEKVKRLKKKTRTFVKIFYASFFSEEHFFSLGQVSGPKKDIQPIILKYTGKIRTSKISYHKTKKNTLKV